MNIFKRIRALLKANSEKEWIMDFYYIVSNKKTGGLFYKRFIVSISTDVYKHSESFKSSMPDGFIIVGTILNSFSNNPIDKKQLYEFNEIHWK